MESIDKLVGNKVDNSILHVFFAKMNICNTKKRNHVITLKTLFGESRQKFSQNGKPFGTITKLTKKMSDYGQKKY